MKIKGLEIYGFGKLENVKIDSISQGIQIIYGRNEAGKSTLMAFIHAILFGFPTKNQTELRYEPKKGFKYGGKLIVETENQQTLTIERVAGKAVGEVKVFDETGKEYLLEDVLSGIDKSMYKGIFSFNIMDIQNLKLLDVEQLGGYLFSSGLIGSDQLQRISDQLSKSLDEQFKPGGRKPIINKLLAELREEEKTVKLWKQKLDQYDALQEENDMTQEELLKVQSEKKNLSLKWKQVEAMLAMQPISDGMEQINLELSKLGDYTTFPTDGLARLEKNLTDQTIYQSKLKKLEQDKAVLEGKMEKIEVNEHLLKQEDRIEMLASNFHKYQQATEQMALLASEKQRLHKQTQAWIEELGWDAWPVQEILKVDASLASKVALKELIQSQQQLYLQKKRLDDQFQMAKEELEQQEERITSLEKEQLPAEELVELRINVAEHATNHVEREIIIKEQLVSQLENQLANYKDDYGKDKKRKQVTSGVIIMLGVMGAVLWFLQNHSLFGVVFFLSSIVIAGAIYLSRNQGSMIERVQNERDELAAKLSKLKESLYANPSNSNKERNQLALAKEEQIQELIQRERLLLSQTEKTYDRIISQFEDWEKEQFLFEDKWKDWTNKRGLQAIPHTYMEEAFDIAEQLKSVLREIEFLAEKISTYQHSIDHFESEVNELTRLTGVPIPRVEEAFYYLKGQLQNSKQSFQAKTDVEHKLMEIQEEVQIVSIRLGEINNRITKLMEQADVASEEELRLKNKKSQEAASLEQKRSIFEYQLQQAERSYGMTLVKGKGMSFWEQERKLLEKEEDRLTQEQTELYRKQTRNKETIRTLEEGGTYSDAVQRFELSKSKLQVLARKWAVHATAKQLLSNTMDYYRTVKLPEVLNKASHYFRYLTHEEYVRVYDPSKETKLMVEHQNGLSFEPKELSQATVEQLYIALRFAVASVWSKEQRFPFILDDTFVNFDGKRTEQAINLLRKLSEEGEQILFFTCHEHITCLLETREELAIHRLEKKPVQSSS